MKKSEIIARVQAVCRTRHLSIHTERAYTAQVARFVEFCATRPALVSAEDRVRAWLEDMAPRVAAKTQAQALNAVVSPLDDVSVGCRVIPFPASTTQARAAAFA